MTRLWVREWVEMGRKVSFWRKTAWPWRPVPWRMKRWLWSVRGIEETSKSSEPTCMTREPSDWGGVEKK